MRAVKIGYWSTIIIIVFILLQTSDYSIAVQSIFLGILILVPLIDYLIAIIIRLLTTRWIEAFICEILEEFSIQEVKNILSTGFLRLNNYSLIGFIRMLKEIYEYADVHYSEEKMILIINAIDTASERIQQTDSNKTTKLHKLLTLPVEFIFQQYILGNINKGKIEVNKNDYMTSGIFCIKLIIDYFILFHINNINLWFIPLSLIGLCIFYVYGYKMRFSLHFLSVCWFVNLAEIAVLPIKIPHHEFYDFSYLIAFLFYITVLILTGIWITNVIWTTTKIEKQSNDSPISYKDAMEVVEARTMPRFRVIWLWATFFGTIFFIILMFAVIYRKQFQLGSNLYCLLLSISIYFGGGNSVFDSLEGLYFSGEVIVSFLVNTLYLAHIVSLILEPKLFSKKEEN